MIESVKSPTVAEPWTVIIKTYRPCGLPHIDSLVASNPEARIFVASGPELKGAPQKTAWRNADRDLRSFWRERRSSIPGERIAVLEHDVLVTTRLPDIRPKGIAGKALQRNASWTWWEDTRKLGSLLPHAVGITPLAVLFISREALDSLAEERWDAWFDQDIFCELRTPTLVAANGLPVETTPLPYVQWNQRPAGQAPGIYHSIKCPSAS